MTLKKSQYKIHQNKDWNKKIKKNKKSMNKSQYKIHQNKDWNKGFP